MCKPVRLSLALFFLMLVPPVFAQDIGSKQKLATEKKAEKKTETSPDALREPIGATALFPYRPFDSWIGQRLIFLPGPKASAEKAYDDFYGKLTHKQYAGRIAKVVSVEDFSGRVHLEIEMEDSKERLRARTAPGKESLIGMALFDDIHNARQQWLGKTLWCRESRLSVYNEQTDAVGFLTVKKYSPLKVTEVIAGWNEERPVRFVLETADGKRGFVDLNLSGTNVFKEVRHLGRFEHCFITEDPRKTRKWDPQIWALIENGQIGAGMTADEVRMSWGEPDKITRTATGENWTYPAGTLVFKNGLMTGMQN